jgi:hypothetical protein
MFLKTTPNKIYGKNRTTSALDLTAAMSSKFNK